LNYTASRRFWQAFDALPAEVQSLAKKSFMQLQSDPAHPSLAFKSLGGGRFQSVRVGLYYRALGVPASGECTGSGSEPTANTTTSSANPSIEATA